MAVPLDIWMHTQRNSEPCWERCAILRSSAPCWGRFVILWGRLWKWELHCRGFKTTEQGRCFGASLSGAFPREWGPQAHEQAVPQTCGEQQVVEQKWWTTTARRKDFSDLQLQWMPLVKDHSYCPLKSTAVFVLRLYMMWVTRPACSRNARISWWLAYCIDHPSIKCAFPFSFTWGQTYISIW